MRRFAFAVSFLFAAQPVCAQTPDRIDAIIDGHVLPGFEALADAGAGLAEAAGADCTPDAVPLRVAYQTAFDAWIAVSHLRFGPTETDNRGFALAFWPDTRGKTAKDLNALIAKEDPVVADAEEFTAVSVAARGLFALEQLLYDEALRRAGTPVYHCALVRAVATDIGRTGRAIHGDWIGGFADTLREPGTGARYQSESEVLQELFKTLTAGLEFTSDARLGRPLGSFDKPRPKRAEAWRSGRSLHNVELSLASLRSLAALLAADEAVLAKALDQGFQKALDRADALDDPIFAGVADPQRRIRIEALKQAIDDILLITSLQLGPSLGVEAGFNSLDGD